MKGFFTKQETISKERPTGKINSCASCGLYKNCQHPKMGITGNGRKNILIIGPSNSSQDDESGTRWLSREGQVLSSELKKYGINLYEDCYHINAVNCYTNERHKGKLSLAVNCCRKTVLKAIEKLSPDTILLLGTEAVMSVVGHRWKAGDLDTIDKWRGWIIPDQEFKAWICPTIAPEFLIQGKEEVKTVFSNDIRRIIPFLDKKVPRYKFPDYIALQSLKPLKQITSGIICFDYETTGLKPEDEGHKIVCMSIYSTQLDKLFSFPIPEKKKKLKPVLKLLTNPAIGKRAHNMKFEDKWTSVIFGVDVQNWEFDSQIAAHQLDNRFGVTGLKFQTYVNFGIVDYSSSVAEFLKSKGRNANEKNTILELIKTKEGMDKLLTYCAYDSWFEYLLSEKQQAELNFDGLPF